jgi:hypothetical protein
MVPLLPIVSRKARSIRFDGAMVGLSVLGANTSLIKNRQEHGALALGGRRLIAIPNNQPIFGRSGRGDVLLEAGGGGIAWGDAIPLFGATIGTMKK